MKTKENKKGITQINIDMTTKEKLTRLILEESYKRDNKISMDNLINLLLEEYKDKPDFYCYINNNIDN